MMAKYGVYLPFGVCVAVIIATGIMQGKMSERWGQFPELEEFAQRLKNVPLQIGDWKGEELEPPDQKISDAAGNVGTIQRVYRNSKGEELQISLVCGRLRDVRQHTPDRCYPAQGFTQTQDPAGQSIDTGSTVSEFYFSTYEKHALNATLSQRIFWSWSADGPWRTPTLAAESFGGAHAIYKLYVIRASNPDEQTPKEDPAVEFIRVFVPEVRDILFPPADLKAS